MSGLAELYFRPRRWELSGRVYERLGVRTCQRVVLWLGKLVGRDRSRPNNYFLWDRSPAGLAAFERHTRRSEIMHLIGIAIPAIALVQGGDSIAVTITLWVVLLVNVHPLLLQRYTRGRIQRVLERRRAR